MDDLTRVAIAARDGDRAALATFVRDSQADVWRLVARLVDRQAADDLTQEIYERALRALPSFRGDSSARTWLLSIARRACVDEIRRRTRTRARDARLRAVTTEVELDAPDQVSTDPVDTLLATLDPDRRTAFVLTQLLGYPYAAAAEVIGCPIGTVRSRVARAREDLIDALGDDDLRRGQTARISNS
jgi:RNA polymerase sigma-70 factor (ECF subfamily)